MTNVKGNVSVSLHAKEQATSNKEQRRLIFSIRIESDARISQRTHSICVQLFYIDDSFLIFMDFMPLTLPLFHFETFFVLHSLAFNISFY